MSQPNEKNGSQEEMRRLAASLRAVAANPAPARLDRAYIEGFTDGMRCAADALEAVADA